MTGGNREGAGRPAIFEARLLEKTFPAGPRDLLGRSAGRLRAVDWVDISVLEAGILGLVGESGCGKSTLARLALRLIERDAGSLSFRGEDIGALDGRGLSRLRRSMQIVFQNPFASFNPRFRVGTVLREVLRVHRLAPGAERERTEGMLARVGLSKELLERYPGELSGGQLQRLGFARALLVEPAFVVCDEPVSALDVSVQAQILNLVAELRESLGIAFLFIAHDLRVVEHISDRVAVMYLGRIVESAGSGELYLSPLHPYTRGLIRAIPSPAGGSSFLRDRASLIRGEASRLLEAPRGCRFRPRCPVAMARCGQEEPGLTGVGPGREVACWLHHS